MNSVHDILLQHYVQWDKYQKNFVHAIINMNNTLEIVNHTGKITQEHKIFNI